MSTSAREKVYKALWSGLAHRVALGNASKRIAEAAAEGSVSAMLDSGKVCLAPKASTYLLGSTSSDGNYGRLVC